jgi:hypothetical protein
MFDSVIDRTGMRELSTAEVVQLLDRMDIHQLRCALLYVSGSNEQLFLSAIRAHCGP